MKVEEERSLGALIMAVVALALLAGAYQQAWFEYDFSTGRKTPPNGPQPANETGVERDALDFYATGWEGDIEPGDPERAQLAVHVIRYGILVTAVALAITVLGEIPYIARIIRRPVGLTVLSIGLLATAGAIGAGWLWLPESMAAYGVDSPYTARLDEPDGYTRTTLAWGLYFCALAWGAVFATWLFKFQAGDADPELVPN